MRLARIIHDGRAIPANFENGYLRGPEGIAYDSSEVDWLPPISPGKMIGLVLNYADHANELGLASSEEPVLFLKPINTIIGNFGKIVYPKGASYMHYEAELAVVIGKVARRVKAGNAPGYVRGYTIANDVTVRDYITNTFRPPVRAKGFDTFCPVGPYLVSPEEISDVSNLNIKTLVNGELRQEGNTRNLMHKVPELIQFITSFMTLEPDDLILTGTPRGISPIIPGDKVEITIDELGTLTSTVIAEPKEN